MNPKEFLKPNKKKILITIILGIIIFSLNQLFIKSGITYTFLVDLPNAQLLNSLIILADMFYWYLLSCLIVWGIYYKVEREPRTMKKVKYPDSILRYITAFLLFLSFFASVFVAFINPEDYLFGIKLGGMSVILYLLIRGIAGIYIAYLLLKRKNNGEILSVLYFICFFVETLITNVFLGFGFLISPLFTAGLVVSTILLVVRKFFLAINKKK